MKGPGLRVDLDVRRIWRCSKCGRIVRTLGQVTAQRCGCTSEGAQWMHLEPAAKKEPFRPPLREHLPEEWEVAESVATRPVDAQATAAIEPPPAENAPQTLEPPAPEPAIVAITEVLTAEIVRVESAPDSAASPPDAFGTGVEAPPRNPDKA